MPRLERLCPRCNRNGNISFVIFTQISSFLISLSLSSPLIVSIFLLILSHLYSPSLPPIFSIVYVIVNAKATQTMYFTTNVFKFCYFVHIHNTLKHVWLNTILKSMLNSRCPSFNARFGTSFSVNIYTIISHRSCSKAYFKFYIVSYILSTWPGLKDNGLTNKHHVIFFFQICRSLITCYSDRSVFALQLHDFFIVAIIPVYIIHFLKLFICTEYSYFICIKRGLKNVENLTLLNIL